MLRKLIALRPHRSFHRPLRLLNTSAPRIRSDLEIRKLTEQLKDLNSSKQFDETVREYEKVYWNDDTPDFIPTAVYLHALCHHNDAKKLRIKIAQALDMGMFFNTVSLMTFLTALKFDGPSTSLFLRIFDIVKHRPNMRHLPSLYAMALRKIVADVPVPLDGAVEHIESMEEIVREMERKNVKMIALSCAAMMYAYAKLPNQIEAITKFDVKYGNFEDKSFLIEKRVLLATARANSGDLGFFEREMREMMQDGVLHKGLIKQAAIALATAENADACLSLFGIIDEFAFKTSNRFNGDIIYGLSAAGRFDDVVRIYQKIGKGSDGIAIQVMSHLRYHHKTVEESEALIENISPYIEESTKEACLLDMYIADGQINRAMEIFLFSRRRDSAAQAILRSMTRNRDFDGLELFLNAIDRSDFNLKRGFSHNLIRNAIRTHPERILNYVPLFKRLGFSLYRDERDKVMKRLKERGADDIAEAFIAISDL